MRIHFHLGRFLHSALSNSVSYVAGSVILAEAVSRNVVKTETPCIQGMDVQLANFYSIITKKCRCFITSGKMSENRPRI